MRVDIAYHLNKLIYQDLPFSDKRYLIPGGFYLNSHLRGWYLVDNKQKTECLFGPCRYYRYDGHDRVYYGVTWIDKLIPVDEWLKEIEKILEGKR